MTENNDTQDAVVRAKNSFEWKGEKLVVTTRSGAIYEFEEQLGDALDKAAKAATMKKQVGNQMTETLNEAVMYNTLICQSCVKPKLDEMEFEINKLKGSETILLKKAMMELYDLESFM